MKKYNPQKIEKRWQRAWQKNEIYKTPDKIKGKENFYCLDMFPYPSGKRLHVGHLHGYVGSDVISRYFRQKGYNVLHPMGFDAFGLPAENAAIKHKIHPRTWTYKNIKRMRKQLMSLGTVYDWSREIITSDPDYYKWTQWMFLQLYKAGLAYRDRVPANWCPSCKTVLANEQIIQGRCERCGSEVIQKKIEQWLFRITDYAEDLLEGLKEIDWPETTKIMQRNWIGKSEGWEIKFNVKCSAPPSQGEQVSNIKYDIPVFTTRTDTLFGCTYLVIAPENPIIEKLKPQISNFKYVEKYIRETKKKTERERLSLEKEKTGIELKGIKAVNPVNQREVPIFVADYVLIHYATGAIMAVPAHDRRDFDFAKKYNLPIIEVIKAKKTKPLPRKVPLVVSGDLKEAYQGEGILINSGRFNGMKSGDARQRIGEWLVRKKQAKRNVFFRLRDWIISRQRYWGVPIPMIFCPKCGWQPVSEKNLPVLLPNIRDFKPTAEGKSPLAKSEKFIKTTCPKCGGEAQRETDTMDTFVCSSWYFLRYVDTKNEKKFASKKKLNSWLPVDIYIGGAEHTVMHLLYARFFTKALNDLGYLNFKEPFLKLRHQGIILGPDGQKMSKSRGNVIAPDEIVNKYGMDTLRLYELFMGPFSETTPWDVKGIEGCYRFLQRVWNLKSKVRAGTKHKTQKLKRLIHKTIKKVTEDIENFKFNTAISNLMVLSQRFKKWSDNEFLPMEDFELFLKLLAPFAPHLSEELWQQIHKFKYSEFRTKNSIHNQPWPEYNKELAEEERIQLIIQVNGKVRDKIEVEASISKEEAKEIGLRQEKIKKWLQDREIKKIIFVPKKLINIVI